MIGDAKAELDVPDGMTVSVMQNGDGPALVFYTGRFACEYNADEVRELRDALTKWLEGQP